MDEDLQDLPETSQEAFLRLQEACDEFVRQITTAWAEWFEKLNEQLKEIRGNSNSN